MKVRIKISLYTLGLMSLLFGIGSSLMISLSFQDSINREKQACYNAYQMVLGTLKLANDLDSQWNPGDIALILEQIFAQNPSLGAAFRLNSPEETIVESGSAAAYMDSKIPEPDTCLFRQISGKDDTHYLLLSGTISEANTPLYLHVSWDISKLYETRNAQQQAYLGIFALMVLLCSTLAYAFSTILTAPLENLSRASRAMASGTLSTRVPVQSQDEIGLVAQDFNTMAAQLEKSVGELKLSMERQENFMGAFAHELKTPMTSIIGYADLLRSGTLNEEEGAEAASYIFSEGKRLESLSRKLLSLLEVQKSDLPLSMTSPAHLIQELMVQLQPLYQQHHISLSLVSKPGFCLLEPDLIKSLLLNLLDNARKSMEHGGTILIQSEMTDHGCILRVLDEGPGIPEEALVHLTQPFYRLDQARSRALGGVGLGLALCQEIVAFHQGTLTFENRPEGGTCVTAILKGGVS